MTGNPEEIVKAATTRERFKFAEAVSDRAYPEIQVPVYLDEAKTQQLVTLTKEIEALDKRIARAGANRAVELVDRVGELVERKDALIDELKSEAYVVTIKGISSERTNELNKISEEAFPIEYEEATSPITGAVTHTPKESPERDAYFVNLIRQAHLKSIVAPDGAVDDEFTVEEVAATWARLPLVARVKVDEAINEASVSVDFYRELVDEVF